MGKGKIEMISVLFENESLLKETEFGLDLIYQQNIRLLKRKEQNITNDISILKPDILFLKISNNSNGLLDRIKAIKTISKKTKIVLLLNYYSDHIYWIAKRFNIEGILKITSSCDDVIKVVNTLVIQSEKKYFYSYEPTIDYEKINELLSDIEKRIFKFIGKGLTTQEISILLNLSRRTVDNHRARILKKLNCKHASKLIYLSSVYNLFNII